MLLWLLDKTRKLSVNRTNQQKPNKYNINNMNLLNLKTIMQKNILVKVFEFLVMLFINLNFELI